MFDFSSEPTGLAVEKGLAYVATPGQLVVINYLAPDTQGLPPTVSLLGGDDLDLQAGTASARTPVNVVALANDDVQVRPRAGRTRSTSERWCSGKASTRWD